MSDTENDEPPHLDPRSVISLAASIPNCSHVMPPTAPNCNVSNHSSSGHGSSKHSGSKHSAGSNSGSSNSSFSQFSNYISQAFSGEEMDQQPGSTILENGVLSFLVSDAYSIEQLAAEASGKRRTSELEGAGIARIDVYWQSGTVCTCRIVQTSVPIEEAAGGIMSKSSASGSQTASSTSVSGDSSSSFMDNMFYHTPNKSNVNPARKKSSSKNSKDGGSQSSSNHMGKNTQVRRIIRRKCTLEALRRILEQPPKLPEVNEDIISLTTGKISNGNDSDNESQCSTVSRKLRKRQLRRSQKAFSASLSKDQQKFLKQQQKQYEKRIKRDEKARQNVGNAILMGGMTGAEVGDLKSIRSLSLDSASSVGGRSTAQSIGMTSIGNGDASVVSELSVAYRAQKKIQDKIEGADMGLAILMGEAQRLERIMVNMRKERKGGGDSTTTGTGGTHSEAIEDDEDGTDRSFSTMQSTDRDFDDEDEDDDESMSSTSTSGTNETEVRRRARIMQGCEIEYSFPHDFHEELEGALMNDAMSDSESENSSALDSEASSIVTKGNRGRRGRSGWHMHISPIVAVPTNGQGCVVLRENGAFDVVGKIPDVLKKKLFRRKGPMPDNIALGTLGRYYVHFEDGSFFFYGPPSLSKILIKGNKKKRRGKDNRGKRNNKEEEDVSVASVAFGKKLDDFFVVYSDGSWHSHGKSIPTGLDDLMKDRKGRADLMWVSLGSEGEWCARSRNGRVWWEGVSDEADEALTEVLSEEGENELSYIDFGSDETYFLLHK